jgi:hypothetical protein
MPTSSRATSQLAQGQGAGRPDLRLGRGSTYVQNPPYFDGAWARSRSRHRHQGRRVLACSATRSPPTTSRRPVRSRTARRPASTSPSHMASPADFNQYGTRRGNHEVMMRGTFANIRIRKNMLGAERHRRRLTKLHCRRSEQMSIYDAAMKYRRPRACRWWSSPARNTAPARRATGPPRAPTCSACGRDRRELRAHPPLEPRRHGRAAAVHYVLRELAKAS